MKFLMLFTLLLSTQVFAKHEICDFEEVSSYEDYLEHAQIRFRSRNTIASFSQVEKEMVHYTVRQAYKFENATVDFALKKFAQEFHSFKYFSKAGKLFALVKFDEDAAFFEVRGSNARVIAVARGYINCK